MLPDGATVADALAAARAQAAGVDVPWDADVGIFGELCDRAAVPRDGDRIEIYRPLKVGPEGVPAGAGAGWEGGTGSASLLGLRRRRSRVGVVPVSARFVATEHALPEAAASLSLVLGDGLAQVALELREIRLRWARPDFRSAALCRLRSRQSAGA